MSPVEAVLCTLGTRGDILPFIALGRELLARGYAVSLLSNENWRDIVTGHGLAFQAIAPKDPSQSGRDDYRFFVENTLPSFRRAFDIVKDKVAAGGTDTVLVYRANMLGMECAADVFGLPHVKVALQPSAIRSFERPPWPLTPLANGRFQSLFKGVVIPTLYAMAEFTRKYRGHTNRFRRSVGLHVPRGRPAACGSEDATLVFAPTWFAMPQKDWPAHCHCVGFPFVDQMTQDDEVQAFIDREGAPIVFTPGTGVADTDAFFDKAEAICRHLDAPAIFLSAAGAPRPAAPRVLAKTFVDMASLLPKVRLIVHHGGIGTTAQALRAGVPQVILPDRFDQPDNAQRIARLGLGAAVMKDTCPPEKWAELIQDLLGSTLVTKRLEKVSADIRRTASASKAADVVENVRARAEPPLASRERA